MPSSLNPTQVSETSHKERLAPYRLLSFLLHADMPSIKRVGPWRVILKTGPMARKFRCRHSRIHEWATWLEKNNLLTIMKKDHGEWDIKLTVPRAANHEIF